MALPVQWKASQGTNVCWTRGASTTVPSPLFWNTLSAMRASVRERKQQPPGRLVGQRPPCHEDKGRPANPRLGWVEYSPCSIHPRLRGTRQCQTAPSIHGWYPNPLSRDRLAGVYGPCTSEWAKGISGLDPIRGHVYRRTYSQAEGVLAGHTFELARDGHGSRPASEPAPADTQLPGDTATFRTRTCG